tara:strand:+ start:306 stop:563 length:258 start_codon:yes stop_codon:yes gene_type:complete
MKTFNALALGYAGAIISAACMLLLGVLGSLGFYSSGVAMMSQWHMFFSPSIGGVIGGMLEAAVIGFVLFYAFGVVYNWLVMRKEQ